MAKKRRLVQVNIRLYEEDVEEAKRIAERDERPYHAVLREAIAAYFSKKQKKVI